MRAYFDGSCLPGKNDKNNRVYSWGLVFDDGETITEISGSRQTKDSRLVGLHETQAFVECVLYCSSHGIKPNEVLFTTDDETTVYASQAGQWSINGGYVREMDRRLQQLIDVDLYKPEVIDVVRKYMAESRMVKVKGHRFTLWNLRCDYLAKMAGEAIRQKRPVPVHSIREWLRNGFTHYAGANNRSYQWFPPFHHLLYQD